MPSQNVLVKLELGHRANCRKKPTAEGYTHDWSVFVRGVDKTDVSSFVEKVVFHLHKSFPKPKRVFKEPPYEVQESGYGSFILPIDIHFKNKDEPKKVSFDYDLFLQVPGLPPVHNIRSEGLTFNNPTDEFKKKLLKGGGICLPTAPINGFNNSTTTTKPPQQSPSQTPAPSQTTVPPSQPPREQSKEIKTEEKEKSPSLDSEKSKKIKTPKTVSPKPVKGSEPVTVGNKRPMEAEKSPAAPKKKKKKPEAPIASKEMPPSTKEVPVVPSSETAKEDTGVKIKIKTGGKVGSETKKKRTSDHSSTGNTTQKNKDVSSSTSRKSKADSSKTKSSKSKSSLSEEKKVEKIMVRRSSGDSWSSSTSSSSGNFATNTSNKRNSALQTLMAEIASEASDDNDVDISTSLPASPTSTTRQQNNNIVTPPQSHDDAEEEPIKPKVTSKRKSKEGKISAKSKKTVIVETPEVSKSSGSFTSPNTNGSVSSEETPVKGAKSPKKKKQENNNKEESPQSEQFPSELVQLYKKLTSLKDGPLLQKVVDVIESTGLFTVSETTVDFDLCELDRGTIKKIEECLQRIDALTDTSCSSG